MCICTLHLAAVSLPQSPQQTMSCRGHAASLMPRSALAFVCRHQHPLQTHTTQLVELTALSAVCSILDSMPLKKPPSPSSRLMRQMVSQVPVYLCACRRGGGVHNISR